MESIRTEVYEAWLSKEMSLDCLECCRIGLETSICCQYVLENTTLKAILSGYYLQIFAVLCVRHDNPWTPLRYWEASEADWLYTAIYDVDVSTKKA